jgi:histidinol-phosphate aminotransferase
MALSDLVRVNVRAMTGYAPGEQPGQGARVVKLNTNENPFPPSPRVIEAIQSTDGEILRRYPHPLAQKFREAAARLLGVQPGMILCGNGSDDVLTVAIRSFVPPGGVLATPEPTYSLYPVLCQLEQARHVGVPWRDGFVLPIDALIAQKPDAIFLANPNAPTGTVVMPDDVAALAQRFGKLVLIDEAYADFWGRSCVSLIEKCPNVIISRTLSKGYGLAGLRFGFAVAHSDLIDEMVKVKDSYNCDAISIVAATAAIEDQDYAQRSWQAVRDERDRVTAALTSVDFDVIPSHGNFVLARVPGGDGKSFYLGLKQLGILVRFFDKPGLNDKLRITIGTAQENDAMLGGVKAMLEKLKAA